MTDRQEDLAFEHWLREGDRLRDQRLAEQAAACYRRAHGLKPERGFVAVQLGNMLKDSGRFEEAVQAYAAALANGADVADTKLQLGRTLRLAGRTEESLETLLEALAAAPESADIAREVVEAGGAWRVQRRHGLGAKHVASLVAQLDSLRREIETMAQGLPSITQLAALPVTEWGLWRRLWRVPQAPASPARILLVVCADGAQAAGLRACLDGIARQSSSNFSAVFVFGSETARNLVCLQSEDERIGISTAPATVRSVGDLSELLRSTAIGDEWIAIASEAVLLDPEAIGWLGYAAERGAEAAAFFTLDEDTVVLGKSLEQTRVFQSPRLKGIADPEIIRTGEALGTIVLARRDAWDVALNKTESKGELVKCETWRAIHGALLEIGHARHIALALASRIDPPTLSIAAVDATLARPRVTNHVRNQQELVRVIVPTCDRADLLAVCIRTLRERAELPERLRITVVDNNSREPATAAYLAEGRDKGWLDVLERPMPFNWSALNNRAAEETSEPILVFANNDIEINCAGWDALVREGLAAPDVGVLGARLLYPDGTIQHAGIVLGTEGGSTEHEGRYAKRSEGGPDNRWLRRRSVAAVTGAFLACRRSTFVSLGGFDEVRFGIWFNDIDFCLKTRASGLRVVYEPAIDAFHHESPSLTSLLDEQQRRSFFEVAALAMKAKWGKSVVDDPYFNPTYARWGRPFEWLRPPARDQAVILSEIPQEGAVASVIIQK